MATTAVYTGTALVDYLTAHTDLIPAHPSVSPGAAERRAQARFQPVDPVTLRLDVMGEIWSARLKDVGGASACLHLDREIAERISDGQPASLWLESARGVPIRLDGNLTTLRAPADLPPTDPVPMTFACDA
jgi:hypothetical protein